MHAAFWDEIEAPWGRIAIRVDESGTLNAIDVTGRRLEGTRSAARCSAVAAELGEYFAGERRVFSLPLGAAGSPFQQRVWRMLLEIPYGTVITYGGLARRIGQPGAARAVGRANGANPIPIVIPCHRVVARGGRLGGYGGGTRIKESLLALEGLKLAA